MCAFCCWKTFNIIQFATFMGCTVNKSEHTFLFTGLEEFSKSIFKHAKISLLFFNKEGLIIKRKNPSTVQKIFFINLILEKNFYIAILTTWKFYTLEPKNPPTAQTKTAPTNKHQLLHRIGTSRGTTWNAMTTFWLSNRKGNSLWWDQSKGPENNELDEHSR
jgi:hypothetical protein